MEQFLGLGQHDPVVGLDGQLGERRRVYLDSAATTLMSRWVYDRITRYLETSCANSHTHAHRAGRATTAAIESARHAVGRLVGFAPLSDLVLFTGNGATGALNYLARALFPPELRRCLKTPDPRKTAAEAAPLIGRASAARLTELARRPLVVTTVMEHHSNLLPWIEAVGRHHCRFVETRPDGMLDLGDLRRILEREGADVRIVAVAGISNVTGVHNPIHEIAALAHSVGAEIVVDAAQMAAHAPISMHAADEAQSLDYVALSGHKMYAPGSRGALVGRLAHAVGAACVGDVGGGMVDSVSLDDYVPKDDLTAREEAGTPNIPGTIAMGLCAELLLRTGFDAIVAHEAELTPYALERLAAIPGVHLYGPTWAQHRRAGVVTFNVEGVPHGLTAAFLNDAHAVALRNECFCAHPYVKRLLAISSDEEHRYLAEMQHGERRRIPGMVRASFGLYSTREDVDALVAGVSELAREKDRIAAAYEGHPSGEYVRVAGPVLDLPDLFA